jgi:hypothetical protein
MAFSHSLLFFIVNAINLHCFRCISIINTLYYIIQVPTISAQFLLCDGCYVKIFSHLYKWLIVILGGSGPLLCMAGMSPIFYSFQLHVYIIYTP